MCGRWREKKKFGSLDFLLEGVDTDQPLPEVFMPAYWVKKQYEAEQERLRQQAIQKESDERVRGWVEDGMSQT